ncbi:MAG: hypothetical protein HC795_06115 [Coleofasciculaceae cyanobacterium RL_1_1]|nr:hypothetical protein [Coleofasciculaceae cyanobacterium RL_1_1]
MFIRRLKNQLQDTTDESVLRIIGDRGSGKTAYLASLAYWPNASSESPVQSITPMDEDGQELITKARDILEQGLELEPTDLDANIDSVKDYALSITLKKHFSGWLGSEKLMQLNISCKDYAGEFFSDLLQKSGDARLEDYLDDCCLSSGLLFLIDGTSHRQDRNYALGMEKLLVELDRTDLDVKQRRIGVVLSKCEQPELWVKRHQPDRLAQARFPLLSAQLNKWSKLGGGSVAYFTASAFGILGNQYPTPNATRVRRSQAGTASVIKNPARWRPFGLVSPIYWLCTGKRHPELDRD